MSEIGIDSFNYRDLTNFNFSLFFSDTMSVISEQSKTPLGSLAVCIGILLLCSLCEGFFSGISPGKISLALSTVGVACFSLTIAAPICTAVEEASRVLSDVSGFMTVFVPVLSGLLISSGSNLTSEGYYTAMMTFSQVVSLLSGKVITPFVNAYIALSITSSLSPGKNLKGLCDMAYSLAKWLITFSMSVFVTVLSLQSVISSSLDNVSRRALRFAVGSFVPVVGGVLGETITAFSGSLELLRSGAGVFVIIASSVIFLPVISSTVMWQITLFILASVSELFGTAQLTAFIKALSRGIAILTGLLLCIAVILMISTALILLVGRKG